MGKDTFYVTTPIYYVNDQPHIGHAYTTILADVLARYHRLLDTPTFFLTGTDEHGLKVQRAAEQNNLSPQDHADKMVVRFQENWKKLEITNDDFIRTTEERHTSVVQKILTDLFEKDEIYKAEYNGWYCVSDERFFTEKDIEDEKCPECGKPVEQITESNYFFRMGKYQDWLVDYIEAHPTFIQPDHRRNETLGFLRKPLQDLCISRPKNRVSWGIELPFDRDFVTYVWFDALVNYISTVGYGSDDKAFKKWWPASYHLIGKDILTTHTVYWPTMLHAMGLEQPKTIFAHGWWLFGGSKMSKSDGNVVDPMAMIDKYGVDATRYFLVAEMSLGQDANFTEEAFVRRYNSDLANDLGNLLSRVTNMVSRSCDGKLPKPSKGLEKKGEEGALWNNIQTAVKAMTESVETMKLDRGVGDVLTAIRAINRYIETRAPWHQAKEEDKQPLHDTLYTAAECLRVTATLLEPIMPERMQQLRTELGQKTGPAAPETLTRWGVLEPGATIDKGPGLFPRIEQDTTKEAPGAPKKKKKKELKVTDKDKPTPEGVALLSMDDFAALDLRTAIVLEAEKIEGTEKLLRLVVMMGDERRQVVAGIALFYKPESLVDRTVVVVANLKPAKIRGVESQGMVLCASKGENLKLLSIDGDIASGAKVQ